MSKISITIDPRTGMAYFPKGIRREGFIGKIDGFPNALTFTLIKPGATLSDVARSLKIIQDDIALRRRQEINTNPKIEDEEPAKAPTGGRQISPTRCHPLFVKYSRDWVSETTGYSKGYLSRLATGKVPLGHLFIARVCFALNQPESELFLPDTAGATPSPEAILTLEECDDEKK